MVVSVVSNVVSQTSLSSVRLSSVDHASGVVVTGVPGSSHSGPEPEHSRTRGSATRDRWGTTTTVPHRMYNALYAGG
ncbi:hypothetical protein MINT15_37750 [Saccharomonospora viridis]|uniref:Uncharacterized protein n=1 Tax=Saccharomonospora viridis TaxID=1852 RepID=A0A837D733_9PSEU|nr:hypothetical protein MINT15_37750 [Saccharomonospora viridis]